MAETSRPPSPALRGYQARTLQWLLEGVERERGATFTVMFPRQAGKNETAAAFVACLLLSHAARGGTVVVCAPTYRPQALISLERVRGALARAVGLLPGAVAASEHTLRVGRASAVFLGASPEAHVAGHTASLALVADEAQEIDSGWFDRQFRPMAASTAACTVLFGTPWDGETLLDRAVARNRDLAAANPAAFPRHREVDWEEVARSLPAYGAYVRSERERLGATHPLYLSQYELVTVAAAGSLLPPGHLAAIEGDHPRLDAPWPSERYVAGLDFGGEGAGADRTVLTIARLAGDRCEVVHHEAWQGEPFAALLPTITAIVRAWRMERLAADATGLGGPLAAQLGRALGPRLAPFVFTAPLKSALGYGLIAAAGTGRLALYSDDGSAEAALCRSELRACGAWPRPGGQLAWGARRGHDDFVASLALCLHAAEAAGPPRLAVGRRGARWT